jgi:hypothetical protein
MPDLSYQQFLDAKLALAPPTGIAIALDAIHPGLFPFQQALVQWCVRRGRAARHHLCRPAERGRARKP